MRRSASRGGGPPNLYVRWEASLTSFLDHSLPSGALDPTCVVYYAHCLKKVWRFGDGGKACQYWIKFLLYWGVNMIEFVRCIWCVQVLLMMCRIITFLSRPIKNNQFSLFQLIFEKWKIKNYLPIVKMAWMWSLWVKRLVRGQHSWYKRSLYAWRKGGHCTSYTRISFVEDCLSICLNWDLRQWIYIIIFPYVLKACW